jgi:polyisoprenoid-binding protein YceI
MSLPVASGTWAIDNAHSTVEFIVRHLGLSNVRGRFSTFDAKLLVGDDLNSSSISATIDLTSVDTNNADRDAHLKGTDFFNADNHPTMTFTSTSITGSGDEYKVVGDLVINGVSKPVTLDVEFNGTEKNPFTGAATVGFSAKAEIKRSDFKIDFQVPLGGDKFLVSDKVRIELEAEFTPA